LKILILNKKRSFSSVPGNKKAFFINQLNTPSTKNLFLSCPLPVVCSLSKQEANTFNLHGAIYYYYLGLVLKEFFVRNCKLKVIFEGVISQVADSHTLNQDSHCIFVQTKADRSFWPAYLKVVLLNTGSSVYLR